VQGRKSKNLKGEIDMIVPVRCFSCGQVIGDKYDEYKRLVEQEGKTKDEALNILGVKKYCCRRMFLTQVDLIDDVMKYK
jgi:DNA-directed RNA polymerase subunit N (RpoN/RPB10)